MSICLGMMAGQSRGGISWPACRYKGTAKCMRCLSIRAAPLQGRAASRPCTLQAATTAAYGKWGPLLRSLIGRLICRGAPPAQPGLGVGSGGGEDLLSTFLF